MATIQGIIASSREVEYFRYTEILAQPKYNWANGRALLRANIKAYTTPFSWKGGRVLSPQFALFEEALDCSDSIYTTLCLVSHETLVINDALTSKGTFIVNFLESLKINDASVLAFIISFAESIAITGDSTETRKSIVTFLEALTLVDSLSSKHTAILSLAESLSIADGMEIGFAANFIEAIDITDAIATRHTAILEALESLVMAGDSTATARLYFSPSESLVINDTMTTQATMVALFEESLVIGGVISTPDGTYDAWVMNAETKAAWKYTNYPFNSYTLIDGVYYGVADDGLYSLDGDTDDGTYIDATIKTGLLNMGSTLFKRIPRAYLGYTSDGVLLFKTITTENGNKTERWYELKAQTADDMTDGRIKMARGVKSVYWQFEIVNVDGADFDFDEIKLLPAIIERRK